jgi:phosphonate transport system permease protein
MRRGRRLVRQCVRWLLVLLRSVPELVWALLFVRVIGLGPTAGVLAIALTYCGMLGKVYAEILESSDAHATDTLLANGGGRLPRCCTAPCRKRRPSWCRTPSTAGNARSAARP